jgi:hypothetical protein
MFFFLAPDAGDATWLQHSTPSSRMYYYTIIGQECNSQDLVTLGKGVYYGSRQFGGARLRSRWVFNFTLALFWSITGEVNYSTGTLILVV